MREISGQIYSERKGELTQRRPSRRSNPSDRGDLSSVPRSVRLKLGSSLNKMRCKWTIYVDCRSFRKTDNVEPYLVGQNYNTAIRQDDY